MSKQLTLSATLSVFAMVALVLSTSPTVCEPDSVERAATAHGPLVKVLIRA